MTDTHFDAILEKLKELHTEYPTMQFGEIIQVALDQEKRTANFNLMDVSSKVLLSSLESYHTLLKRKRR